MVKAVKKRYNMRMWQWAKNQYHLLTALLAHIWYGFPSRKLTVIGITGTSGKTTTTHMIYDVLKAAGYKVSLLSTIKAVIGGKDYNTGFHVTTPDPHVLPKFLKKAVLNGDTHFVLEVSSHALDQNRAAFLDFEVGVLTTLAHEHLDYHKTFINYAKAKFKLLHQAKHVVIPEGGFSKETQKEVKYSLLQNVVTFGVTKGNETQEKWKLKLKMPGEFNLRNALAAAAVGDILGVSKETIKKSLDNFTSLAGRWEEISTKKDFRIVIDFAHKPDALEGVLSAARDMVKENGRVIILYGCASQRDTLKRPMMGEISGRLADITVLADEDPRFESPEKIINEMAAGCERAGAVEVPKSKITLRDEKHLYYKIPNRKEAIEFTITKLAKKDDFILLCGKGHEQSMNYMGKELAWSEHKAVEEALEKI